MNEIFKFAQQVDADIERRRAIAEKGKTELLWWEEIQFLTSEQQAEYWASPVHNSIRRVLTRDYSAALCRGEYSEEPRGFNDQMPKGGHQAWEAGE